MLRTLLASTALVSTLLLMPFAGSAVLADDDNIESTPQQGIDPTFDSPTVSGVIYHIDEREGAQVLTVFDRSVGSGGLGVDVYVRDPGLVAQVKNRTVCVGRFVTVEGIRTGPKSLDAQGIQVDPTTGCHTPGDAK
jgi:hypothetical protein